MTFSISGSLITQTGTDANLALLSGVAGVTTLTNGTKTVYNIGNNRLQIDGALTFDPRFEELQLGTGITVFPQVQVNGTLNIGSDIVLNGVSFAPPCTAMVIPSFSALNSGGSNEDGLYAAFRVAGVCNHFFGSIFLRGPIGLGTSPTTGTYRSYSRNAAFIALGTAGSNSSEIQIRQRSRNNQFDGITTQGIWWTLMDNPALLKGAAPFHGAFAFSTSSSSVAQTWIAVRDYPGALGNSYDVAHRLPTVWTRFINAGVGTGLKSAGNDASSATPNNCGLQELRQELSVTARNVVGAAISSGGIYIVDKNNGARCPHNTAFFGAAQPNYGLDREYATAFNGSGIAAVTADGGVLTGVNWRNVGGLRDVNNQQDFRGEQNAATDVFVVRCRSYGKLFSDISVVLRGVGGTTQGVTLFDNPNVIQSQAVALAHTGISLVDHGASPVAWNGKNFGITITANRTTNPGITASDIYHHLQARLADVSTTFHGKLGGAWHNMLRADAGGFVTTTGEYGGLRATKGVRVIDEAGSSFPGIAQMQADDGSFYVPPVQYQLQFTNLVPGSDVVVRAANTSTILAAVDQAAGTTWSYFFETPVAIDVDVFKPGYVPKSLLRNFTPAPQNSSLPVSQSLDRNYS
jgi:hypothetical protein